MAIIRQMEELPAIIRATDGEIAGTVSLGMSTTLAASPSGCLMELCRSTWPQLSLRFTTGDSLLVRSRIEAGSLDIGVVFEDEPTPGLRRTPLFRHRLFLVRQDGRPGTPITLHDVSEVPLILPAHPNITRTLIDRAFADAGLRPIIAAETDVLTSMLAAVQSGLGSTIVPKGDFSDISGHSDLVALPIEPPLYLTASVATSATAAPSRGVEAVRALTTELIEARFAETLPPGADWLGG